MTSPLSDSPTPIPVEVAAVSAPVPVAIAEVSAPVPVVVEQVKRSEPTTASIEREKLKSQGQRRVNIIWEITQSVIACAITGAVIWNATHNMNNDVLNNAFFLIVSMYFVRTNHQRIGGVDGKGDDQGYQGR